MTSVKIWVWKTYITETDTKAQLVCSNDKICEKLHPILSELFVYEYPIPKTAAPFETLHMDIFICTCRWIFKVCLFGSCENHKKVYV